MRFIAGMSCKLLSQRILFHTHFVGDYVTRFSYESGTIKNCAGTSASMEATRAVALAHAPIETNGATIELTGVPAAPSATYLGIWFPRVPPPPTRWQTIRGACGIRGVGGHAGEPPGEPVSLMNMRATPASGETESRQLAKVRDYSDLHNALRAQVKQLDVPREQIDCFSGLQQYYSGKLLAAVPSQASRSRSPLWA